jgi:hypothetical protein
MVKLLAMKKALIILIGAVAPLYANGSASDQFDIMMTQMRQVVEEKVVAATSGLSPLVAFANGVEKSCNLFKEINARFETSAFDDEHATVRTTFARFCTMVSHLKVKPWGIRQLEGGVKALNEATKKAMRHKIQNEENYQTALLIKDFSRSMFNNVCPMLRIYVGTAFERNVVDRVFRMTGFFFRHWWWLWPALIASGIGIKKLYPHIKKKIFGVASAGVAGTAAIVGASLIPHAIPPSKYDGCIYDYETQKIVKQPIVSYFTREQSSEKADKFEINQVGKDSGKEIDREVWSERQLDQVVPGPCPYFTLWTLYCLYTKKKKNILDKDKFNDFFKRMTTIVGKKGWLCSNQIKDLIIDHIPELRKQKSSSDGKKKMKLNNGIVFYEYPGFWYNKEAVLDFRNKKNPLYIFVFTGNYKYREVASCLLRCTNCNEWLTLRGNKNLKRKDDVSKFEKGEVSTMGPCLSCNKTPTFFRNYKNKDHLLFDTTKCTGRHTLLVKLSWKDGRICSNVYDSYARKDNRHTSLVHDLIWKAAYEQKKKSNKGD